MKIRNITQNYWGENLYSVSMGPYERHLYSLVNPDASMEKKLRTLKHLRFYHDDENQMDFIATYFPESSAEIIKVIDSLYHKYNRSMKDFDVPVLFINNHLFKDYYESLKTSEPVSVIEDDGYFVEDLHICLNPVKNIWTIGKKQVDLKDAILEYAETALDEHERTTKSSILSQNHEITRIVSQYLRELISMIQKI